MNKKNKILAVVMTLLVVTLITTLTVIIPRIIAVEEEIVDPPETQAGESFGTLGKYKIHDSLSRDQVSRIYIHNGDTEYAFIKNKEGKFVIEGMEDQAYNEVYFSALFSVVSNPLALTKVASNAEGYDEYGITDSVTYWEVTTTDGTVHHMDIGHMLHTAGGYYVSYRGRDAVYVLGGDLSIAVGEDAGGTSLDQTVLQPIEFYVTPVLIAGIPSDYSFEADKFTILKDGELFLSSKIIPKEDQVNPDALVESILVYPAAYSPDTDKLHSAIGAVTALQGTKTVKAAADSEVDYVKYGLENPKYIITFEYMFDGKDKPDVFVIFASEAKEDGTRYATSSMNPTIIVEVNDESLGFLDEELLYWINPYVINHNITSIEKITVTGEGESESYSFDLYHGVTDAGKPTLYVDVTNHITGEEVRITDEEKVWDFRSFYRTMLYAKIEDNIPLSDAEIEELMSDEENCVLTYEYTLASGTKRVLQFWQYSTRRTFMTIDGKGEFYVYLDRVDKVLSDAGKVFRGETVDSHAKN